MNKICILIDHPTRDIPGNIILAKKLIEKKNRVFFVPSKYMAECLLLKPNLVITNYARPIYENFFKILKKEKIKIITIDTEGAPFEIKNSHYKSFQITVTKYLNYIENYYLWGQNQLKLVNKYIENNKLNYKNKLYVTGSPMFDYHNIILKEKNNKKFKKKIVLINLGFALINPRFSKSVKVEFENLKKEINITGDFANKKIIAQKQSFKKTLKFISKLSKKLGNNYKIVINPHPFESYELYKNLFYNFKNILVLKKNNIVPVINLSNIVLSINCQTSVDSLFLNKPTLNLNFLNKKIINSSILEKASIQINSFDQCINTIKKYSKKEKAFNKLLVRKKNFLKLYFNNFNSNSSDKISKIINKIKFRERINTNFFNFLKYILNQYNFILITKMFIIFILEKLNIKKNYLKFDYDQKFYNNEINKHMKKIQNKREKLSFKNCYYKEYLINYRLKTLEITLNKK